MTQRYKEGFSLEPLEKIVSLPYDPFFHSRRRTTNINGIGSDSVPRVFSDLSRIDNIRPEDLAPLGYLYSEEQDKWHLSEQAVDYLYVGNNKIEFELPGTLSIIQNSKIWKENDQSYPVFNLDNYRTTSKRSNQMNFLFMDGKTITDELKLILNQDKTIVLILRNSDEHSVMVHRKFIIDMVDLGIKTPVILNRSYNDISNLDFQIKSSIDIGSLYIDGLGDGVWVDFGSEYGVVNQTVFGILQASRMRISKTEYISCPSCGRTLFDLQETTSKIREVTNHLKGVKIGIMGCIVNGPGEMADADYGYVGTGSGYISLYKGQEVVKRNIPTDGAVEALIGLIKEHGDWIDPVSV